MHIRLIGRKAYVKASYTICPLINIIGHLVGVKYGTVALLLSLFLIYALQFRVRCVNSVSQVRQNGFIFHVAHELLFCF